MTPETSTSLGIAISYQHPAILDDLSVLENLRVSLPDSAFAGRSSRAVAKEILHAVGLHVPLSARADLLTVAQKQLLEIGKALAIRPKVLILDEPTASLDRASTDLLFERIRSVVKAGTSVIYITHRLAEIRQIGHRVTVLRDGRVRGQALVSEVTDDALLSMIVGRELGSTFPPKVNAVAGDANFSVRALSGRKFRDVSFDAAPGQIVGIAGVAGNGQSELMRALAGLQPSEGEISLGGRSLSHHELLREAAYMPSDRLSEGLAGDLTVRENASLSALGSFASFGIVSRRREVDQVTGRLQIPCGESGEHRVAGDLAVGRQSAEGRAGARVALRPETYHRRRTDPGGRRRRARGNLPNFAGSHGLGQAGHREFLRRQGTRGPLRQGCRAVERSRRRDPDRRGRRRSEYRVSRGQRRAPRRFERRRQRCDPIRLAALSAIG